MHQTPRFSTFLYLWYRIYFVKWRKSICIFFAIVNVVVTASHGQTLVENPKHPIAKNAGRIVELAEVLRIEDDGTNSIFRSPRQLSLGKDGSLFFMDIAEGGRLYRYSPDGKLVFKALKSGQGPGECLHPLNYMITGDIIRVQSFSPPKILDFSFDGRYLKEIKVDEDTHGLWFLTAYEGNILAIRSELFASSPFKQNQEGTFSIANSVYEISPDFKHWRKIYEFPVRSTIKRRRGAVRLDMIDAALQGPLLHIVHSCEYQIESLNIRTGEVVRIMKRTYERQRIKPNQLDNDPQIKEADESTDPFYFDIFEIHSVGDNLWVFTSTERKGRAERLVDVFDAEGRFVDSFFLRFASNKQRHPYGKSIVTNDGCVFIPEQDEDGLISIGKYRIRDIKTVPSLALR